MAHQPMKRYELIEHPNGHYWKILDTLTDEEYAKQDAIDLLNMIWNIQPKTIQDIEKALNQTIYTTDTSNVFENNNFRIKQHTFYGLIMEQSDRINELEQMLYDVENELEELERENRRLCSQ